MKKVLISLMVLALFTACSKNNQNKNSEKSTEKEINSEIKKESKTETNVQAVQEEAAVEKDNGPSFDEIRGYKSKLEYDKAVKELTPDYLTGKWELEVISEKFRYIYFVFDGTDNYYIYSPYGGYFGDHGKYSVDGNKVTLNPVNEDTKGEVPDWLKKIWPKGIAITIVYDYDFKDFYTVGVLKNDELLFRNFVEKREPGTKCIYKGIEVIEIGTKKVVAKENLKLRNEPSVNAEEARFYYGLLLIQDAYHLDEYSFPEQDENTNLNVMLKGLDGNAVAKTVKQDTINGITAPWYLVELFDYDGESMPEGFWVFGGYLEDYDESKKEQYKKELNQAAAEKKIIKKE